MSRHMLLPASVLSFQHYATQETMMTSRLGRLSFVCSAVLTIALSNRALAAEFSDGTIVVSDNWCAPGTVGTCNDCNLGRLVNRALCNNSHCDNIVMGCDYPPPIYGAAASLVGPVFIANETLIGYNWGWTSDEQGYASQNAVCPPGYAMVGMNSTGDYSDNIRVHCQQMQRAGGWGGITPVVQSIGYIISDAAPNHQWFMSPTYWTSGVSCTGSYCANMLFYYTSY